MDVHLLVKAIRNLHKRIPLPPCLTTLHCPSRPPHTLLPPPTTWTPLQNHLAIIPMSHIARVSITYPRHDKEGRGIHQHKLQNRIIIRQLIIQYAPQDGRILGGLLARRDGVQRVRRQAKVLGRQTEVLDLLRPGAKAPAQRGPGARDLVQLLVAADDEGLAHAVEAQGLGKDGAQVAAGDADDAGLEHGGIVDVHGVGEGAEEVEDGAPGEFFAHGGDEAHAGVEGGGEEEGVVGFGVEGGDVVWADAGEVGWGREGHVGDEVGGAGLGGGGAVAVLGEEEEGGGEDGGGGGDVEGVVGVAACAYYVALGDGDSILC